MKKYSAVIFDLDGTLMNTLGDLLDATNYMLAKYGYPLVDMEKLRKAVGNGALNQLRCCFPDTVAEEELLACVEEYKPYYALHCEEKTAPYEGVSELLTELKRRGVPMAIVTNKPDEAAQRLCRRWFGDWMELFIGERAGVGDTAIVGFVSTLASSMTTFEMMKDMDDKGAMLNAAFAVSAAFVLADHLAFTMAFRSEYVPAMILGKLISGACALVVAAVLYRRTEKKTEATA